MLQQYDPHMFDFVYEFILRLHYWDKNQNYLNITRVINHYSLMLTEPLQKELIRWLDNCPILERTERSLNATGKNIYWRIKG